MESTVGISTDSWITEAAPTQNNSGTRKLKLDGTSAARKRAYLHAGLPFEPGSGVEVSAATLSLWLAEDWSGTHTITVQRVDDSWRALRITWNSQPGVTGSTGSEAVSSGAAGDQVDVDVTALLAEVADGSEDWDGLRLVIDGTAPLSVWSQDALEDDQRPLLSITWTEEPEAPTNLAPAGGRVISKAQTYLGWQFGGAFGETVQTQAQVQVATDEDFTSIEFDSGPIPLTETELDLAATAAPAVPDGGERWWRVKAWDDAGRESDWSEGAHYIRQTKGTAAVYSPVDGATIGETTPNIAWTFTGATQESFAVYLEQLDLLDPDAVWEEVWRQPRALSTEDSIPIPYGYITRTATKARYRVRVRVWDDADREHRPGDPPWAQDLATFTWVRDAVVTGTSDLVVSGGQDEPSVVLTFQRTTAPDYFVLVVHTASHEVRPWPRIDPEEVALGGGVYAFTWWGARPGIVHTYEVEAVENVAGELKHSEDNATADYMANPVGIWVLQEDNPAQRVRLFRQDTPSIPFGGVEQVFFPIGRQDPVLITSKARGREGTVTGMLAAHDDAGARMYSRRLYRFWKRGRVVRLIIGSLSIPVRLAGPPEINPVPALGQYPFEATFTVYQVGEFDQLDSAVVLGDGE